MADVGDMYRFGNPSQDTSSAAFTDLDGDPADPTAVTLVVQKPDGTQLAYGWPSAGDDGTLTRESAGRFYFEVVIDQAGKWQFRLAGTGVVYAASEGSLKVNRQRVVTP